MARLTEVRERLRDVLPDAAVRRRCCEFFRNSILYAHRAPASWVVTAPNRYDCIRLHVGRVETITIDADGMEILLDRQTLLPGEIKRLETRVNRGPARVTAVRNVWRVQFPASRLQDVEPLIQRALLAYIDRSILDRSTSLHASHYEPAVLACMEEVLGKKLPRPAYAARQPSKPTTPARLAKLPAGAGFGTAEENREVESAAVRFVTRKLEHAGWKVESVESERNGYDLRCKKGRRTKHVEVKGIRGSRLRFVITASEVRAALEDSDFELHVVTKALTHPRERTWSGRAFHASFTTQPLQYFASLKSGKPRDFRGRT